MLIIYNFLKILLYVIFKKEIFLVNSPLQFINLLEYKYLNKHNFEKLKHKTIFLSFPKKNEIKIIKSINKKINNNANKLLIFKDNTNIVILLLLIKIRMRFSKLNLLVLGDYNNYLFQQFYKISKKIILLDDGTNAFNFYRLFKMEKKNLQIFTIFDRDLFNHNNIIINKLTYLKSKINSIKKKKYLYILGGAGVEKKFIKPNKYLDIIKSIQKKYKKYKIIYFPHPKELNSNLIKYSFVKVIKPNTTIEMYLINSKFKPSLIIGFNSTSFFTIKRVFGEKIKLINYNFTSYPKKHSDFFDKINIAIKKELRIISNNFD